MRNVYNSEREKNEQGSRRDDEKVRERRRKKK